MAEDRVKWPVLVNTVINTGGNRYRLSDCQLLQKVIEPNCVPSVRNIPGRAAGSKT